MKIIHQHERTLHWKKYDFYPLVLINSIHFAYYLPLANRKEWKIFYDYGTCWHVLNAYENFLLFKFSQKYHTVIYEH